MSKASEHQLGELHGALAEALTPIIKQGVTVMVKGEDGEGSVMQVTAPAAYFAVAVALLKNNNITADPAKNEALSNLEKALAAKRQGAKEKLLSKQQAAEALEEQLGGLTDDA